MEDSALGKAKQLLGAIRSVRQLVVTPEASPMEMRAKLARVPNVKLSLDEIEQQVADWRATLRPEIFRRAIQGLGQYEAGQRLQMNGTRLMVLRLLEGRVFMANLATQSLPQKFNATTW